MDWFRLIGRYAEEIDGIFHQKVYFSAHDG